MAKSELPDEAGARISWVIRAPTQEELRRRYDLWAAKYDGDVGRPEDYLASGLFRYGLTDGLTLETQAKGDVNVMVGAAVARELYGLTCPILEVSATDYETVAAARRLRIHEGGTIVLDG